MRYRLNFQSKWTNQNDSKVSTFLRLSSPNHRYGLNQRLTLRRGHSHSRRHSYSDKPRRRDGNNSHSTGISRSRS